MFEYPVIMLYPWSLAELHTTLNESLEIAMDYLEGTGLAYVFARDEECAAQIEDEFSLNISIIASNPEARG